jgi:ABC-type molybdate transport system substrate-binding protein
MRYAASIVAPDAERGVPGGGQVEELFERLGIVGEIKAKTRYVADAREVAKRVAAGTEEVGVAVMSDLIAAAGVSVVGPIVEPVTSGVTYASVVIRGAAAGDAARAFIAHLLSAEAAVVLRKAGYAPSP